MKPLKQSKKLTHLNVKAENCRTREEAQNILNKAKKLHNKIAFELWMKEKEATGPK